MTLLFGWYYILFDITFWLMLRFGWHYFLVDITFWLTLLFGWHYFLVDFTFGLTLFFVDIIFWLTFLFAWHYFFVDITFWLTLLFGDPLVVGCSANFISPREFLWWRRDISPWDHETLSWWGVNQILFHQENSCGADEISHHETTRPSRGGVLSKFSFTKRFLIVTMRNLTVRQ